VLIYEYKLDGTPAKEDASRRPSDFGVILTVLEPGEEKAPAQELTDDLLSLIASFSQRLYGMRSHKQKEFLQCAQAVITNP
jgi:putative resolvase